MATNTWPGGYTWPTSQEVPGVTAATMPRGLAGTTITVAGGSTGGTVALRAIALPSGLAVANIDYQTVAAETGGATHGWVGLCIPLSSTSAELVAVSADLLTTSQAATTYYRIPLVTPYVTTYGGVYLLALLFTATTTVATVTGGPAIVTAPTYSGVTGTSVTPVCSTGGTATTPPAVGTSLTLTPTTGTGENIYMATA